MKREKGTDGRTGVRGRRLVMVGLVAGVIGLIAAANSWKGKLTVQEVHVTGLVVLPKKEIVERARITKGDPLFEVDLFAVRERILENPFVRSADIRRDVPSRITILIQERVPFAIAVGDRQVYLDAEAYVLPVVGSANIFDLPVITGSSVGALTPGKAAANAIIREALGLLQRAREVNPELFRMISEVHVGSREGMILLTADYGVPVFVGHGDLGRKLVKLDGFLKAIAIHRGIRDLEYIDLRFEDQVVVRWSDTRALLDWHHSEMFRLTHFTLKKELSWTT